MSNFFQNLPYKLANFMAGRNGPDALARASLWMGVLFTFLEIITGLGICSLIGMVFLLSLIHIFGIRLHRPCANKPDDAFFLCGPAASSSKQASKQEAYSVYTVHGIALGRRDGATPQADPRAHVRR